MGKCSKNQPTAIDVAKAAGVSSATISRVFNQHAYVKEDIRERVLKAARELGYAPTITSSQRLFAVVPAKEEQIFQPYFNSVVSEVAKELFANSCLLQIFNRKLSPYILRNSFRGAVVFRKDDARLFQDAGIPCVLVNEPADGCWNVATDHTESTRIATEYLLKKHHRRIAFLGADLGENYPRLNGFKAAMLAAGIPENELITDVFDNPAQDIPAATGRLLKKNITALIVDGEGNGIIADRTIKAAGLSIPQDISLISFENENISGFLQPAHTTVMQDFKALGKAAVNILLDLTIRAEKNCRLKPQTLIFHNHIIERESCREADA